MSAELFCILVILPCVVFIRPVLVIANSSGGTCLLLSTRGSGFAGTINSNCSSCNGVYIACRQLLVDELLPPSSDGRSDESNSTIKQPSKAKAYGYGFLLSTAVSGTSLFALFLVPCLKPGAKLFFLYKPINALMMGSASFALLADAVLHILPEIFGSSTNTDSSTAVSVDPHLHLWRACLLLVIIYAFFVFKFFLHAMRSKSIESHNHLHTHANSSYQQSQSKSSDTSKQKTLTTSVAYKSFDQKVEIGDLEDKEETPLQTISQIHHKASCFRKIKPLAWLLITGDSIHNFTDGVALGVAISVSLSLGISTAIALVLHEIPHELGDFAILVSTGMKWYTAFLLNFLHSLAAMVGLFVGVAIGTNSETAVDWILAATIGIFFYISLVDLLPSIIHNSEKGCMLAVIFIMANIGFAISSVTLLLIAIYEDELNQIVH